MAFFKHTHVPPREQQQYSIETLKYNPSPERRGYIAVDSQHFCVRCCCVSNLPARPSREETAVVILTFYTGWQKWFDLLWEFCASFLNLSSSVILTTTLAQAKKFAPSARSTAVFGAMLRRRGTRTRFRGFHRVKGWPGTSRMRLIMYTRAPPSPPGDHVVFRGLNYL